MNVNNFASRVDAEREGTAGLSALETDRPALGGLVVDGKAPPRRRLGVLLVDNHDVVHIGLTVLLRRERWVGRVLQARTGAEAVWLAARYVPAVAIVDLYVGEELGTQICGAIRARIPDVRVLLTSSSGTLPEHVVRGCGAAGFIAKDRAANDVLRAVYHVAQNGGGFIWQPDVPRGTLSRRQQQILGFIAEGATNRDIAAALGLSAETIKQHTSALYRCLGVRNRAEAVHRAQSVGLLTGPTHAGLNGAARLAQ
jgi:two-component system response regulator DesR